MSAKGCAEYENPIQSLEKGGGVVTARELELEWYQANGDYPERIVLDSDGIPYVIGDRSWNQNHPDQEEYFEDRCHWNWKEVRL